MVAITYLDIWDVLNLSTLKISIQKAEDLIQQAIDLLNLYGNQSVADLTGITPNRTTTATGRQRGAIIEIAKSIYYRNYHVQLSSRMGSASSTVSPSREPSDVAKEMASRLVTRSVVST